MRLSAMNSCPIAGYSDLRLQDLKIHRLLIGCGVYKDENYELSEEG